MSVAGVQCGVSEQVIHLMHLDPLRRGNTIMQLLVATQQLHNVYAATNRHILAHLQNRIAPSKLSLLMCGYSYAIATQLSTTKKNIR
jgi:hypothetical protein